MFGLIVLLLIAAYLAISVVVVKKAMRWAQSSGRSARRWGWIAGLAMYLLVFWDLVPTIALHQYLCATKQGLWIYKTVEEWQRENPGVAETLAPFEKLVQFNMPGMQSSYMLNRRIARVVLTKRKPIPFLPVFETEERILDREKDEVLARYVRIGSGYGSLALGSEGAWKFWLTLPDCNQHRQLFSGYTNRFRF